MKDLLEAIQIFLKHGDVAFPFHCEHDELTVHGYDPSEFSAEEKKRLDELGFNVGEPYGEPCFYSFKYGSC